MPVSPESGQPKSSTSAGSIHFVNDIILHVSQWVIIQRWIRQRKRIRVKRSPRPYNALKRYVCNETGTSRTDAVRVRFGGGCCRTRWNVSHACARAKIMYRLLSNSSRRPRRVGVSVVYDSITPFRARCTATKGVRTPVLTMYVVEFHSASSPGLLNDISVVSPRRHSLFESKRQHSTSPKSF